MSKTVTIEGREVPLLKPDERETLEKHEALMMRLGQERHLDKHDLLTMITLSAGAQGAIEYKNAVFEAVLALAAELYDFHPDENPPAECPSEDYEIVLAALDRIRKSKAA